MALDCPNNQPPDSKAPRRPTPVTLDLLGLQTSFPSMSRRNGHPKLDLKLNLSPPNFRQGDRTSPRLPAAVSPTSPPSSCLSTELNQEEGLRYSDSPEATSMMLAGCPRCLMYVMLSESEPKCPKCKSSVLLDFLQDRDAPTPNKNTNTG